MERLIQPELFAEFPRRLTDEEVAEGFRVLLAFVAALEFQC